MSAITSEQKQKKVKTERVFTTKVMVTVALLSTMAYILMLFELPPYLGFLRFELSDIPAIIGALQFGPLAGVIIELIKNLIKAITASKTYFVGELANFIISAAYIAPAAYLFRRIKGKYKPLIAFSVGTIAMTLIGALMNYFVTIPLYATLFGGMDVVIGVSSAAIPAIKSLGSLVVLGITPFNIVKGILISVIGYYTYKLVRKWI